MQFAFNKVRNPDLIKWPEVLEVRGRCWPHSFHDTLISQLPIVTRVTRTPVYCVVPCQVFSTLPVSILNTYN